VALVISGEEIIGEKGDPADTLSPSMRRAWKGSMQMAYGFLNLSIWLGLKDISTLRSEYPSIVNGVYWVNPKLYNQLLQDDLGLEDKERMGDEDAEALVLQVLEKLYTVFGPIFQNSSSTSSEYPRLSMQNQSRSRTSLLKE